MYSSIRAGLVFVLCIIAGTVYAQIPPVLTHQGRILESDSQPISGVDSLTFRIYSQATGGTSIWSEQFDVTFENGYYSVVLGENTTLPAHIFNGDLYLGVTLANNEEMAPRSRITSVPYAIRSDSSARVSTNDGTPIIDEDGRWVGPNIDRLDEQALTTFLSDNGYNGSSSFEGTENMVPKFNNSGSLEDSLIFDDGQRVGILTTSPASALHVDGAIQIGSESGDCSEDRAGSLRWEEGQLELCDGSNWMTLNDDPSPVVSTITPTEGSMNGQTPVTITGENFRMGTHGTLSGNPLTEIHIISDSKFTAITPAGDPGTADLVITNPNGASSTLSGEYTFTSYPTGNGNDGELTVVSAGEIVNVYKYVTDTFISAGSTTITLEDTGDLSVGDEIMIHNTQHIENAGTYEFKFITAINNDQISFSELENDYHSGTAGTQTASVTQIIRVPQFSAVTINPDSSITASPWNGSKGGIVVFKTSGDLTIHGAIEANGKGFRGGDGHSYGSVFDGESWSGLGIQCTGDNSACYAVTNGGGGSAWSPGNPEPSSGGGSYGTQGSNGAHSSSAVSGYAGIVYGIEDLSLLHFGSGGGGAADPSITLLGGSGGGIIFVTGNSININGEITSTGNPNNGWDSAHNREGASGAGGSIWLQGNTLNIGSDKVTATGSASLHNRGGAGGKGRIRLDSGSISGSTDPTHYSE